MKNTLCKIFKISLLIYPITFVIASFLGIVVGIDSGWAMPAMSNNEKMYGWDAVWSYLIIMVWGFVWIYLPVLVFQVGYIIYRLIARIKSRAHSD